MLPRYSRERERKKKRTVTKKGTAEHDMGNKWDKIGVTGGKTITRILYCLLKTKFR